MIDCIIIDDEQHAIDLLEHYISRVPYLSLVGAATDPVTGLALVNEMHHGLIFLDVQMPNLTGVDILRLIPQDFRVIMTTAYAEYALDGFEYEVVDYLLKPIAFPRFLKAVNRLVAPQRIQHPSIDENEEFLFVKTEQKGKLLKADSRHITYIEGLGNYVTIHMDDQPNITAYLKLLDLELHLSTKGFLRIHKSFIVSLTHLTALEGNFVKIQGESRLIPIGNTYKKMLSGLVNARLLPFPPKNR